MKVLVTGSNGLVGTALKEIERAEKNYFDSLKVLEKFNRINGHKRN